VNAVAADGLLGARSAPSTNACEGAAIEPDHAGNSTGGAEQASQSAENRVGSDLSKRVIRRWKDIG